MIYYPTVIVQYSLFVLKVPLNPKQTNNYVYGYLQLKGRGGKAKYRWEEGSHLPLMWMYFMDNPCLVLLSTQYNRLLF